jgi:hypothetical protein
MTETTNEKELQEERKKIIARLLDIQKRFMDLEREKGVTEKDLHQGAPEVEEQRLTDAYEAGYEDGKNNNFDNVDKHKG